MSNCHQKGNRRVKKGNSIDRESIYECDSKTGRHVKTKEWDNTYIILDKLNIMKHADLLAAEARSYYNELFREAQVIYDPVHERQHGLQSIAEFYEKILDFSSKQ